MTTAPPGRDLQQSQDIRESRQPQLQQPDTKVVVDVAAVGQQASRRPSHLVASIMPRGESNFGAMPLGMSPAAPAQAAKPAASPDRASESAPSPATSTPSTMGGALYNFYEKATAPGAARGNLQAGFPANNGLTIAHLQGVGAGGVMPPQQRGHELLQRSSSVPNSRPEGTGSNQGLLCMCGAPLSTDALFCGKCGKRREDSAMHSVQMGQPLMRTTYQSGMTRNPSAPGFPH